MEKNLALEEEVCTVRYAEGFLHVVVGDEYADILLLQLPDDVLYILHGNGVDTGERFVQHNELGVYGQAACNLRSPTLTT